jgi:hypothetical protein
MSFVDLGWELGRVDWDARSGQSLQAKRIGLDVLLSLQKTIPQIVCIACFLAIASVAAYDIFLTLEYPISLHELELNPVGRWLMDLDNQPIRGIGPTEPPNVLPFVCMKGLGTVIVLLTIGYLLRRYRRIGNPVAIGVASFQIGLACFLTYA